MRFLTTSGLVVALTVSIATAVAGAATHSNAGAHWWTTSKANAQLAAVNPQFHGSTPTVITHAACVGAGTRRSLNHVAYFQAFRCEVSWTTTSTLFPGQQSATVWVAPSPYVAHVICTSMVGYSNLTGSACMHSHIAPPATPTLADATRDVGHALAILIGAPAWDGTLTCSGKSAAYACAFADPSHTGMANVVYQWEGSKWVPLIQLICVVNGQRGACRP